LRFSALCLFFFVVGGLWCPPTWTSTVLLDAGAYA
jgi:hypothetical protein